MTNWLKSYKAKSASLSAIHFAVYKYNFKLAALNQMKFGIPGDNVAF